MLVLVLQRLAQGIEVAVTRDDEPGIEVRAVLVEELEGPRDEDGVGSPLEEASAHPLRDGDRLDAGELERHEERLVLRGDLLPEDGELHADGPELGGLLEDRLEDREGRGQRSLGVLTHGVVDVLPIDEESDVGHGRFPS